MKNLTPNTILYGDSLEQLKELPNNSVDMCMTSPPYWALRDYGTEVETIWDAEDNCEHCFNLKEIQTGTKHWNKGGKTIPYKERKIHNEAYQQVGFCIKCGAWKGQLGLEPTLDLYIKHLCDVFDEVKRVTKDKGTCWVNLGDTYWGGGHGGTTKYNIRPNKMVKSVKQGESSNYVPQVKWLKNYQSKSLCMIPFRFAIEMINRGWILRNTIIWHKPNAMPTSAKDRFTVDFEYLFFFSKSKKYYFLPQLEPLAESSLKDKRCDKGREEHTGKSAKGIYACNASVIKSEGRNKRCVWSISTKSFKEAHFATYPEKICETPINAGCPELVCAKCGKAKRELIKMSSGDSFNIRVRDVQAGKIKYTDRKASEQEISKYNEKDYSAQCKPKQRIISKGCDCDAGFIPGIVLDPFFGAGTTGLVALKQRKNFIGIELKPEYIEIAQKRLKPYLDHKNLELKKAA